MDQPDTAAIHRRYTLSSGEIARGVWALWIYQRSVWVVIGGVSAFAVAAGLLGHSWEWLGIAVLLLFVSLVVLPGAATLRAVKQVEPQELIVGVSSFVSQSANAETRIDWEIVESVRQFAGVYLLIVKGVVILVPQRAFQDAASEGAFRALCTRHSKTHFV